MPLTPGTRLGPYEILAHIGAGGMGEVYRAKDTKLDREVAIKVLPAAVAQDRERLARFEREAKILASLNHPNIAQIYGLEEDGDIRALVMELVPGSTLLVPQPIATAVNYSRQIAEALEAAHEKGITHRDLKPGNIMVTPEGVVKVLDFGLASVPGREADGASNTSPTMTMAATQAGMIMGTAAYMSPEQAAGKAVDKRSDIWSFGVVLWEMLTGKSLFSGETVSHTLAHVLTAPIDFTRLPASTPAPIVELVNRCLDRDPRRRLRDIGEARLAIEKYLANPGSAIPTPGAEARTTTRIWMAAAGALALGLAAISFLHFRQKSPDAALVRFTISAPGNTQFPRDTIWPVLSPDGRQLVFRAVSQDGIAHLWVRSLDSVEARLLPGTEDCDTSFWSPDGKSIGFFAGGKLKRIEVAGGPALTLADFGSRTTLPTGAWSSGGTILFSRSAKGLLAGPLFRIPASGGASVQVTKLDTRDEVGHDVPWFLPDGRHFLFGAVRVNGTQSTRIGSLDSSESALLDGADQGHPIYSAGYVLTRQGTTLLARPFDTNRLAFTGDAALVAVVEKMLRTNYDASANGALVYGVDASSQIVQLTWFERDGRKSGVVGAPAAYANPGLSRDGKRLAVAIREGTSAATIWVFDLARGVPTQFTFDPKGSDNPTWSPDGSRIAFYSDRTGHNVIYSRLSNGAGREEMLMDSEKTNAYLEEWSRDGKYIVYRLSRQGLWAIPVSGDRKPFSLLNNTDAQQAAISPDGRWVAYRANDSSKSEVFIQSFAPFGGRWRVSGAGGSQPSWRADGKELFYLNRTKMMSVDIKVSGSGIDAGIPRELFDLPTIAQDNARNSYVGTSDGKRFLCLTKADTGDTTQLTLVLNWTAGLKK